MPQFQAPKGTFDVLPPASARYARLVALFAEHVEQAGYGLIVGPMFEDEAVFRRVGETTDIVRKEMYDFDDKGGRRLALRPDGTAPVARAFVEHRPPTPWKVWYVTPKFRYERPQAGRYRQHHELGLEALGTDDPDLDVEVIDVAWGLYVALGLQRISLRLTSLGDDVCRPGYRDHLVAYFLERRGELCDEHRERVEENPLRILDCKQPACVAVSRDAPRMLDHLCEPCAAHFARVRKGLEGVPVPYVVDSSLVRGLDYYTRTTFEFTAEALDAAQNGAGGGGRYDGLVGSLGGPPTPGIGFGLGIERILLACDAEGVFPAPDHVPLDVFVIDTTGGEQALDVCHQLRAAGLRVDRAYDDRSWRAQMKGATRTGARLALVIEAAGWSIRTLQEKGEPEPVEPSSLIEHIRKRLQ